MRAHEILADIYCFRATIRVRHGRSTSTVKTLIYADGMSQARALLVAMYGDDAVVSVTKVTVTDLREAVPNRTKRKPVPRVLPTDYTHALAQKALLNQMKRNALHVKPKIDDLRAAQDDFEAEQKRVNRAYDEALKDREKWAAVRKRTAYRKNN